MATNNVSDVVSGSIDGEYPVAGVDNDTQGFRDNFSIIKDNFVITKEEITDLYQRTPKLDEENNFDGSVITQASMKANTETVYTPGTFSQSSAVVDFTNGHYQIIKVNTPDSIELVLEGWPQVDDQVAKLRVQIEQIVNDIDLSVDDLQIGEIYVITFAGNTDFTLIGSDDNNIGTVFVATGPGTGTGKVKPYNPVVVNWRTEGGTIVIDSNNNWPNSSNEPEITIGQQKTIIDFWSPDKGTTIFAHYIGTFV